MQLRFISCAVRFMRSTKRGTVPLTRWASATAASLPETIISPLSSAPTPTRRFFGSTPIREPTRDRASLVTFTLEPSGIRRATRIAVIALVTLAIGRRRSGSLRQSTSPVSRSKSRPARGGRLKSTTTGSSTSSSLTASGSGGAVGDSGPFAACRTFAPSASACTTVAGAPTAARPPEVAGPVPQPAAPSPAATVRSAMSRARSTRRRGYSGGWRSAPTIPKAKRPSTSSERASSGPKPVVAMT